MTPDTELPLTYKERQLYAAIARLSTDGWRLLSVGGDRATLTRPPRNGLVHAFMVLITFGLWMIFIIYRALHPVEDTMVLEVNKVGHVRIVSRNSMM